MEPEVFREMLGSLFSPEIQGCLSVVRSIAGYELSDVDREPFLYFHNYLTNPQPQFITIWRSDPKLEHWYKQFVDGFLNDVQNTLACVLYHYGRLVAIEEAVVKQIEKFNYRSVLGNSTVAVGNTLVWDFEYQAFILAYRRCLDYLARALCTYFKNDCHSFRKLGDFLKNQTPKSIAAPLIALHLKHSPFFEFVLSDGTRKSVRDKISHYSYVPAGCINLSRRGLVVAGGGENLGLVGGDGPVLLSEVIDTHVANLRVCIREMICTFVDAVRKERRD